MSTYLLYAYIQYQPIISHIAYLSPPVLEFRHYNPNLLRLLPPTISHFVTVLLRINRSKMTAPVAQFENRLSSTADAPHSHDHDGHAGHSHDQAAEEHGHTHEHMEHAGESPSV
jgi:hypothetical protein